jgi:dienelactone hydrolase
MRILWSVLFSLTLINAASALQVEKTHVQSDVGVPVYIFTPDKVEGKIPAVILLSGSGGVRLDHRQFYAEEFARMGVATIFVDSFTPRGVKETVTDQTRITAPQMGRDARSMLNALKDNPKIDANRVGVIGFSKGAGVVMNLAMARFNKDGIGRFAFYIAMYPPCGSFRFQPKLVKRPLEMIIGEKDGYNNPERCKEYESVLLKENGPEFIHLSEIKNAQHVWDVPGPAHVTANGENYSRCKFIEVAPEVWFDSTRQYKIYDHGQTKERKVALSKCLTHQVSWGYNKKAAEESLSIIKKYVATLKETSD